MVFPGNHKVWKISPGRGHFQWRRGTWQSEKVISIGWEEFGSLDNFDAIDQLHTEARARRFAKPVYIAKQLWAFRQVKEGDIAVAYGSYTILDLGIVNGPYFLSIDKFVEPDYDLYGHRKPVIWLKVGPVPIGNTKIAHYMAQNNTIFQITEKNALAFIQKILSGSFQFRVTQKAERELPEPQRPKVSCEFDEEEIAAEIGRFSKALSTEKKEGEIDVAKEFSNLKVGAAPGNIRTHSQVRARVILTGTASTDLQKRVVNGIEVYTSQALNESIIGKSRDIERFYNFVVRIIDTMVPGLGKKVVLVSVEDPVRDAYRYHVRTVFNFNRYQKETSRFFWFFVAARELAYLRHNRFDYRHNNLMRALLIEAYERGF